MDRTNWLAANEARSNMYEAEDDHGGHDEIAVPEWTGRPCGCVTDSCPRCKPLWYDADGNFTGQTPLYA